MDYHNNIESDQNICCGQFWKFESLFNNFDRPWRAVVISHCNEAGSFVNFELFGKFKRQRVEGFCTGLEKKQQDQSHHHSTRFHPAAACSVCLCVFCFSCVVGADTHHLVRHGDSKL